MINTGIEGMTWQEWCDSSYNTLDITYDNNGVVWDVDFIVYYDASMSIEVFKDDIIESGRIYVSG